MKHHVQPEWAINEIAQARKAIRRVSWWLVAQGYAEPDTPVQRYLLEVAMNLNMISSLLTHSSESELERLFNEETSVDPEASS